MSTVLDVRGLGHQEARALLGSQLATVGPCEEVLCIVDGGDDSQQPWRGLTVYGDGVTWRPLVVEPTRVLMTLKRGPCLSPVDASVVAYMTTDHKRIHILLENLAKVAGRGDPALAETYLDLLVGMLRRHMEVEESLLMPILSVRHGQQRGPASVLRDDHIAIVSRLEDLSVLIATPWGLPRLATKAYDLGELLRSHTELEEQLVYSLADKHLNDEERASLLDFCRAMA